MLYLGLGDFRADYSLNFTIPSFKYTSNNTLADITFSPVTSFKDNLIEGDETIKLIILSERDEVIQVPNSRQTATITIIDDDCKHNERKLVYFLLRRRERRRPCLYYV